MKNTEENTVGERFVNELINLHKDYDKRMSRMEEQMEDLRDTLSYHQSRSEETFPDSLLGRLLDGENPLRVYREHRKLSQTELSNKSGVGQNMISEIEAGRKNGSIDSLKKLSKSLNVDIDDLA